jgi:hypothetical protein
MFDCCWSKTPSRRQDEMTPMEEDLNNAISEVIARHEQGGFVTRWVTIIETIADDGTSGLWTATSEGLKAWDTVGMLGYGLDLQRAATFASVTGLDQD